MPSSKSNRRRHYLANLARAAATIEAVKLATGCTDCGYNTHPQALHFDHRDPQTKRVELGWVENRSKLHTRAKLDRFLTHVATYCDVRCANCHAVRTAEQHHAITTRTTTITITTSDPTLF